MSPPPRVDLELIVLLHTPAGRRLRPLGQRCCPQHATPLSRLEVWPDRKFCVTGLLQLCLSFCFSSIYGESGKFLKGQFLLNHLGLWPCCREWPARTSSQGTVNPGSTRCHRRRTWRHAEGQNLRYARRGETIHHGKAPMSEAHALIGQPQVGQLHMRWRKA